MKGRTVITLNGRSFDAITGDPAPHPNDPQAARVNQPKQNLRAFSDIAPATSPKPPRQSPIATAKAVHQRPQKSQTLMRTATKKPVAPVRQEKKRTLAESAANYRQSPAISKFAAPQEVEDVAPITKAIHPIPPQPPVAHPVVTRALAKQQQAPEKPQPVQSAKELKEMLIKERLADVDQAEQQNELSKERKGIFKNRSKLASVLTSSLTVLLLAGYLTYINLPNISMRVAAARAGIAANMPNYKPNGYDVNGAITYSPGEVAINYKAETGNKTFSVKQKSSTWDSQAVLDNYVSKQSETYLTYQERGLTIYSFDNKAAWVNGGILYTIEGDASLTSEQVLKIATSM